MTIRKSSWILLILSLFFWACDKNENITPDTSLQLTGTGNFTFTSYAPLADKPVEVFYNIPKDATTSTPILFVFSGSGRDASTCRDDLIQKSNSYGFIVVAPEFSDTYYPGANQYNLGNMFENGEHPSASTLNDESVWTFSIVKPLFETIKTKTGDTVSTYDVFGHSAGGQFAHRYLLFKPNDPFKHLIAASSGWYTLPVDTVEFPYGLGSSPGEGMDLHPVFTRSVTIIIGQSDTDPNSANLRHTPDADAQGMNRLERAQYFYTHCSEIASQAGIPFNWSYKALPNVGHDFNATSNAAVDILYQH